MAASEPGPGDAWACVLAGGASRRFGSDKAHAAGPDGTPRTVAVARRFAPRSAGGHAFAVARVAGAFDAWGLPTITDPPEHAGAGPLAGLLAGLQHREAQAGPGWLLLLACDLLAVDPKWAASLPEPPDAAASVFRTAEGFFQPLPGRYHTRLIPRVRAALVSGDRSFQRLLAGVTTAEALPPPGLAAAAAAGNTPHRK